MYCTNPECGWTTDSLIGRLRNRSPLANLPDHPLLPDCAMWSSRLPSTQVVASSSLVSAPFPNTSGSISLYTRSRHLFGLVDTAASIVTILRPNRMFTSSCPCSSPGSWPLFNTNVKSGAGSDMHASLMQAGRLKGYKRAEGVLLTLDRI